MPEGVVVRGLHKLPPLEDDTDAKLLRGSGRGLSLSRGIRGGISKSDEAPHMLFAACQQDQLAYETNHKEKGQQCRGAFTHALLQGFKSQNQDNLTYAGVMLHMRMSNMGGLYVSTMPI